MADLIEAMERLWFHQIIFVSKPTSLQIVTINPSKHSSAHNCMNSQTLLPPDDDDDDDDDEISSLVLSTPSRSLLYKDDSDIEQINERPTISNLIARRAHSHSSLPATQPQRPKRHVNHPKNPTKLQKSMSCRSFQELELEELKGFMDLGFNFKKEHLSPRLLTVIPGLQRKGSLPITDKDNELAAQEGGILFEEEEEEDQSSSIIRPYLSEAWLIREPDSPLLNLRVPRVTAASDMKKHLRFWARSVASVVQQES